MKHGTASLLLIIGLGAVFGCNEALYLGIDPQKLIEPGSSPEEQPLPQPPMGANCLLEYNSALVPDGTDPCCYRDGDKNACNTAVECNERSGGGCCLIYGTNETAGGGRCCLYADGRNVDGAAECEELLSTAASVTPKQAACLLEYNSALVPDGTDPCCYRDGDKNACNTAVECNELSGGGCCLIYGTNETAGGGRCCLYADGRNVDGAAECSSLLTAP